MYQTKKSGSYVYIGPHGGSATNTGQICLINQLWLQTAEMHGKGCITAAAKSSFYFSNTALEISRDQTLYLASGDATIVAIGSNNPQTWTVRGFGQYDGVANKLGLSSTLSAHIPVKAPGHTILIQES